MRKKFALALVAIIFILGTGLTYAAEEEGLYKLQDAGTYDLFTNYADGYALFVDKGMTVDLSYAGVCAVLENESKRIEIYKQNTATISKPAYINYSNKFLNNWVDHYWEASEEQVIGGHNVTVTAWSRDKLSRVENDKNYYVCLEIGGGANVYSIFIKANAPIYQLGGYAYLAENFITMGEIKPKTIRRSAPVNLETRGWNDETKAFYGAYFGESAPLTWGIFEPETAGFDYTQLHNYEQQLNYTFPILLNYSEFDNTYRHPNLKQRLETAYREGKTLELTLQTSAKPDGSNMVYDVLSGEYDAFLQDYAQVIAEFGHPVLFRLGNEMNGDWCPYSSYNTSKDTMIFKEFYRYIYSFFTKANAQNVIWVWNPNHQSFPNFAWNNELMYYPGDEYVDVIGMTAYNTGTYYGHIGERWQEFSELYDASYYRYLAHYGQPLMITEFASASMGGDKEQWVINMFNDIKKYDRIKVAVWWDGCDWDADGAVARSYVMDESPALMNIFKKYLNGYTPSDWQKDAFGRL